MKGAARVGAIAFALALCASAARADGDERREELFLLHSTVLGPVGGVHIVDAASAPRNTFRIGLNANMFFINSFLVDGDHVNHVGGSVALSYSAHENLEVFGSFLFGSTSNTAGNPELIQSVGDVYLGLKGYHWVLSYLAVGGDGSVSFLNSVGSSGPSFESTSGGIRANLSADLRQLPKKAIPLIARFNLQYWFDNSGNLIEDTEAQRYARLNNPLSPRLEMRHLVTAIERFAVGVNRTDMLNVGLGFEAPLRAGKVGLHPLLEWAWGIPINRQGYSCLAAPVAPGDSCLSDAGVSAFPMTITPALRVLPPVRGLSVTAGVEVGVTGTHTFVRELAPTAPYRIWLGLAYAIDPVPKETPPVAPEPPEPSVVRLRGTVRVTGTGKPVGGAVVRLADAESSPLITGPDGTFSVLVERAEQISLEISHMEHPSTPCVATAPHSSTEESNSVPASSHGEPPVWNLECTLEPQAQNVEAEEKISPPVPVVEKPKSPHVQVTKTRIVLRGQISFATGRGEILPNSEPILLEVADALAQNPDIHLVEIQGHTDNRGSAKINRELSAKRAEAVKLWLVKHGVDASRLNARGYGPDRPLVPNLTAKNRAKNRRVQFVIRTRAD